MARIEQQHREELTGFSRFTVEHVGGTIVGRREISKQMVGGWMEGGQTIEVTPVLADSHLNGIRTIIAEAASSAAGFKLTIEDVGPDKRLEELPEYESQVIDDISLAVETDYLDNRNIPDPMVAVTRTARDIWEIINVLRIPESPIAGLSLAEAKLQLSNAWMYGKAVRERGLWAQGKSEKDIKEGWPLDEFVKELKASDIKATEPTLS